MHLCGAFDLAGLARPKRLRITYARPAERAEPVDQLLVNIIDTPQMCDDNRHTSILLDRFPEASYAIARLVTIDRDPELLPCSHGGRQRLTRAV